MKARLILILLVAGCDNLPQPNFERMKDQPNFRPFERAAFFDDGRAMQAPPDHTISTREPLTADPIPIDRPLLERGRNRFEIYCAACHGLLGDGDSEVAHNMDLKKPPSLVADKVRQFDAAQLFRVATLGYGLMPALGNRLTVRDRWAVVAYVRALQLSQAVALDQLPAPMRAQADEALTAPDEASK